MADIVARLRDADTTRRIGESYADTHERRQRDRDEAAAEIERLNSELTDALTDLDSARQDNASLTPYVQELRATIERLRAALVALRDGCEFRPLGIRYREDGQPSKHDKCIHGVWMYEDCGQCVSLFVEAALEQEKQDDC